MRTRGEKVFLILASALILYHQGEGAEEHGGEKEESGVHPEGGGDEGRVHRCWQGLEHREAQVGFDAFYTFNGYNYPGIWGQMKPMLLRKNDYLS